MRLSAELLQRDFDSMAAQTDHDTAVASVRRSIRMIKDSAGKIDSYLNQFRLSGAEPSTSATQAVDLGEVIHNAVQVMEPVIKRYTRRFQNEIAPRNVLISGQGSKIEQVVMNLVLNACEALRDMDHGIALRWAGEAETAWVGFQVSDEGGGISEELLPRVMEPFFSTKRDRGGTGLGLSVCRSIVEDYKGVIQIDSKPGVGTSVTVLFPRLHAAT